jgi:serine-type D-Ala-D-Ala carboxypeptidase/endopeptidase (penicillin-binding protein 4)
VKGRVVTNRLRVTALAALALLNAFTLGAGVAMAGLLPGRLALWQVPRVAGAPLAAAPAVLRPAAVTAPAPALPGLAASLTRLLGSPSLGPHTGAVVTDLATGRVLFSQQAASEFVPASSEKLLTAVAALSVLGPQARISTKVVPGATHGSLVLVGGGDPTLAAGLPPKTDYPQPATLAGLARTVARWLHAQGQHAVRLGYDTSLFTGPGTAPGWPTSYITTGNVTPITSLEVDQGRLTPAGLPEDADDPGNYRPRSFTPAADAAAAFARFLRAEGVRVLGAPSPARAPRGVAAVAQVRSPAVAAMAGWMLRESNNVIAEDLARQVALHTGAAASFSGAAAAVTGALRGLGVGTGIRLADGSGLSPQDQITPQALAATVRLAARPGQPGLSAALAGLPVAGFSGTLAPGQSVFGGFGPAALGRVRAKTGNLTRVASLTGFTTDAGGRVLVFAFMADRLKARQLTSAASVIDKLATALSACGCR